MRQTDPSRSDGRAGRSSWPATSQVARHQPATGRHCAYDLLQTIREDVLERVAANIGVPRTLSPARQLDGATVEWARAPP